MLGSCSMESNDGEERIKNELFVEHDQRNNL